MNQTTTKKTALIFGATGLSGGHLLQILLNHSNYNKVITFGRSTVDITHPKLSQKIVDFDKPDTFEEEVRGDEIFCCLGTTRGKAGKDGFYKVDFTYCYQAAKLGKQNGVKQFLLISSMGADSNSMFFYSEVKGKIENAVKKLNYQSTHILRPSLLLGDRKEQRFGESFAQVVMGGIDKIAGNILGKYSPIEAEAVAKAMVYAAQSELKGIQIYNSDTLQSMTDATLAQ